MLVRGHKDCTQKVRRQDVNSFYWVSWVSSLSRTAWFPRQSLWTEQSQFRTRNPPVSSIRTNTKPLCVSSASQDIRDGWRRVFTHISLTRFQNLLSLVCTHEKNAITRTTRMAFFGTISPGLKNVTKRIKKKKEYIQDLMNMSTDLNPLNVGVTHDKMRGCHTTRSDETHQQFEDGTCSPLTPFSPSSPSSPCIRMESHRSLTFD